MIQRLLARLRRNSSNVIPSDLCFCKYSYWESTCSASLQSISSSFTTAAI